ncbi:2Fe-2S iron-sulfur cluster-binding protein [Actinoplanes sp. NPDC020271]|uniref:2Fe-2S iron-sulfur cluster-binding protein n=1 Tax=Actinoplanes sp. NPDC020271 TaxID=3363896 RepID=UPI00379C3E6D
MSWKNNTLNRLSTAAGLEAVVGRPASMIVRKEISALDAGCRTILDRSPAAAFGYRDGDGTSRTTFIGGTPGFVRVLSDTRISFLLPEPGEPDGPVSFFFLLPGVGEVLRVNGSTAGRKGTRVTVGVEQAYVHCAQAVLRSRLWQPPAPPPAGPPALADDAGPLCGPGIAEFLAAAPFLALSTWDSTGGSDTSPRGDQPAVVRVLDGRTLVLADRKGNKRADTLHNLLHDDRLSFAALVPGRSGVLHVRGRGAITDDAALLATMALRGMPPHLALVIDVEHAEVSGSDAMARARLWSPGTHLDRDTAPDLLAIAGAHLAGESAAAGRLVRSIKAIPGMSRLLRRVMNRAYRSGLGREGYEEIGPGGHEPAADGLPERPVRVVEVRRETPSTVTLVLADAGPTPGSFDFRPGQFFTLIADIDGRPVRRPYSASSAPGSPHLEVTVKHVDGGHFSGHVHHGLRAGDRLAVRGPSGSFHAGPHPLVLIAAGSGVTPMMSMIRTRLADPAADGRIDLLYSSRRAEDTIFAAELSRLERANPGRLTVTHVLTEREGRLGAEGVRRWLGRRAPADGTHYYLCGPEPLMEVAHAVLTEVAVPGERVHRERYTSAANGGRAATVPQEMTVERDGRPLGTVVVDPGQTLLDAGLAAGLPMPYSCTVGNCGDCMVRLRDGDVALNEPNCLTPRQRAAGYVLACVGCPLSKVTLDIAEPGPE